MTANARTAALSSAGVSIWTDKRVSSQKAVSPRAIWPS